MDGALLAAIARVVRLAKVEGLSLEISQPRVMGLALRVWGLGLLVLGVGEMGLRVRAVSARVVRPRSASFELTILKLTFAS